MKTFDVSQLTATRWRNGGGTTREISSGIVGKPTRDPQMPWDWRVSVASITADGDFSCYPGVERIAVLVDGIVSLNAMSKSLSWTAKGDLHAFPGDTKFFARLQAPSARLFNVMVMRERVTAKVNVHRCSMSFSAAAVEWACLFVVNGRFQYVTRGREYVLEAERGLMFSRPEASGEVALLSDSGCIVEAQIFV